MKVFASAMLRGRGSLAAAGPTLASRRIARPRVKRASLLLLFFGISFGELISANATPTVIAVTTNADSGPGSLREAVGQANTAAERVVIVFQIPCSGSPPVIALQSSLTVSGAVSIVGKTDCGFVCIDGSALPSGSYAIRVVNTSGLETDATLLDELKIQNVPGEAIRDESIDVNGESHLVLYDCTITKNQVGVFLDKTRGAAIGTSDQSAPADPTKLVQPPAGPGHGGNVISGNGVQIKISGGGEHRIQGNYIGTNMTGTAAEPNNGDGIEVFDSESNLIGGLGPGQGNLISGNSTPTSNGILLANQSTSAGGNRVLGNVLGLALDGTTAVPNQTAITAVNSPNNIVDHNVISANAASGVSVQGAPATGNRIVLNWLGVDVTGTAKKGNGSSAISAINAPGLFIAGNTIADSKNLSAGLNLGSCDGAAVQGNYIGTDKTGLLNLGNSAQGVMISSSSNVTIGGAGLGLGNVIAFNGRHGIGLISFSNPPPVNDAFRANGIYQNSFHGIDLKNDDVTANDSGDPDDGPNHLQNFPVLTGAVSANGVTTIGGTFNSSANTTFTLDFFASATNSASSRQGQFFLGTTQLATDNAGNSSFNFPVSDPAPVPAGFTITATAVDPTGNTSEFAAPVNVTGTAAAQDVSISPAVAVKSGAMPGSTLSYAFAIKNLNNGSASGPLTFSNVLPSGLSFVSASTSNGTIGHSGNNVTANLGSLPANGTATVMVSAVIDLGAAINAYIRNAAKVTTDQPDPNPYNNMTVESTVVLPNLRPASIARLPNGNVRFTWLGAPNRAHTIEGSNDLGPGRFFPISTVTADGNGMFSYEQSPSSGLSPEFFRAIIHMDPGPF